MSFQEIVTILQDIIPEDAILQMNEEVKQPFILIKKESLIPVMQELHENEACYFDYLSCLSGYDLGEGKPLGIIYHLYSIPLEHHFVVKVELDKPEDDSLPVLESVTEIWKSADWHEREVYDMYGINFLNHPDLRRILLPADWEGYPLRKDYKEQEYYHGIKVAE